FAANEYWIKLCLAEDIAPVLQSVFPDEQSQYLLKIALNRNDRRGWWAIDTLLQAEAQLEPTSDLAQRIADTARDEIVYAGVPESGARLLPDRSTLRSVLRILAPKGIRPGVDIQAYRDLASYAQNNQIADIRALFAHDLMEPYRDASADPLFEALDNKQLYAAQLLVEAGYNPKDICPVLEDNPLGKTYLAIPLGWRSYNRPVIEFLIAHGARLDADGQTGLRRIKNPEISALIEHYEQHPQQPFRPQGRVGIGYLLAHYSSDYFMHIAAYDGDAEALRWLAKNGWDVNTQLPIEASLIARAEKPQTVQKSMTPLLLATYRGHEAAVQALLELGANVEAEDEAGLSALDYCCGDLGADTPAPIRRMQRLLSNALRRKELKKFPYLGG
ncbi:MAG: hypothetical protein B7X06_03010, partial [Verrucomicrobia bacterium 21-51-4]